MPAADRVDGPDALTCAREEPVRLVLRKDFRDPCPAGYVVPTISDLREGQRMRKRMRAVLVGVIALLGCRARGPHPGRRHHRRRRGQHEHLPQRRDDRSSTTDRARYRCSATLVTPTVLLTAAHCTFGTDGRHDRHLRPRSSRAPRSGLPRAERSPAPTTRPLGYTAKDSPGARAGTSARSTRTRSTPTSPTWTTGTTSASSSSTEAVVGIEPAQLAPAEPARAVPPAGAELDAVHAWSATAPRCARPRAARRSPRRRATRSCAATPTRWARSSPRRSCRSTATSTTPAVAAAAASATRAARRSTRRATWSP